MINTNSELYRKDNEQKCYPVSLSQQRLWILDQLDPGSAIYHISLSLRLTGPLVVDAIERSLRAIVARHESLRTTFDIRNGMPVQLIASSCTIPLQISDISMQPAEALETQAYSLAREEIRKPFDLGSGPLIRAALFRLGPEHHIFVSTMHHIVSDGWSAELFVRELAEHYEAFSTGVEPSLKPLPMQYSEFAVLQRHLLADERIEQQLSFWRRTLAGAPSLHEFPCDYPRPEQLTHAGASQTLRLDNDLIADLQQIARRQRTTLFILLTAAFQILLFKYSKQQDILIGIPVSGRNIPEAEPLIGLFVNTIVLRTPFSENPTFIEVLKQVHENLLDAMSHQELPFERIVDAVRAPRGLDHNPLFQIMFATFRAAVQSRKFGQLIATPYVVETNSSRFDLSVNIIEGLDDTWWVQAEYSTELLERTRIAGALEAYKVLLRSIVNDDRGHISDLRISRNADEVSFNVLPPVTSPALQGPITDSSIDENAVNGSNQITRDIASETARRAAVPVDDVEPKLVQIWQRLLKTSPIPVDADFFELGGTSLLAIQLIANVNRAFEKKLPVSTIFRDTTIQRLAMRLREERIFKSSFYPVVETGVKLPLFVVGSNHLFKELGRSLGPNQPFFQLDVYALQEERLIAQEPLLLTVRDIAAHFVRDITTVQPSGPYFLGGSCEGGVVALEIARQFQQLGHEIAMLIQFDTPPTGYLRYLPWHKRVLRRKLLPAVIQRIRGFFMPAEIKYVWSVIWNAVYNYTVSRTDLEITLFRATERVNYEDVAIGWDQAGTFRVFDVPGDHVGFVADPGAHAIISRVLEDVYRRISPSKLKLGNAR